MSSPDPWNDAKAKLLAASLGVPISWPNEDFDLPEPPAAWLQVSSESHFVRPIDMGAGVWQEQGTLRVHIIVPKGAGISAAQSLAKQILNTFRGLAPGPTVYLSGAIGTTGQDEVTGMWEVLPVAIDWRYQDVSV